MKYLFTVFFLVSVTLVQAQTASAVPNNIRALNTLERLYDMDGLGRGDLLYGIPVPPGKVIGDTYLNEDWRKGTILLYENNKMVEGYPLRYDIKTDEIEIKTKNAIKVLKGDKVQSFVWIDSVARIATYFVNARDYKIGDVPATGFLQVISDGAIPVLMKTTIQVKQPDYVVQFDVGSRDQKILKKKEMFYTKDNVLFELPTSRKKLLPLFGTHAEQVERFIKVNSLDVKNQNHVRAIFDHYNSLVKA